VAVDWGGAGGVGGEGARWAWRNNGTLLARCKSRLRGAWPERAAVKGAMTTMGQGSSFNGGSGWPGVVVWITYTGCVEESEGNEVLVELWSKTTLDAIDTLNC
jgi:hypothetical protein